MKTEEIEETLRSNLALPTGGTLVEVAQRLAQAEETKVRGRAASTEPRSIRIEVDTLRDVDWLRSNLSEPGAQISQVAMVNLLLAISANALRNSVAEDLLTQAEEYAAFIIRRPHWLTPAKRQELRAALAEKPVQRQPQAGPKQRQPKRGK